ncbi:hypothetical protein ABZ769_00360 [Streptomyces olivoreticuli]
MDRGEPPVDVWDVGDAVETAGDLGALGWVWRGIHAVTKVLTG